MSSVLLLLISQAFVCNGKRVQATARRVPISQYAAANAIGHKIHLQADDCWLGSRSGDKKTFGALRSFAFLLFSVSPAVTFNPSVSPALFPVANACCDPRHDVNMATRSKDGLVRRSFLQCGAAAAAALVSEVASADLGATSRLREDVQQSLKGSGINILLKNLTYKELDACPSKFYLPQKGQWSCIEISGTAVNQGPKETSAAAVFGVVRDAEGNDVLSVDLDGSVKTGIASLGFLPKGPSPVSFVVAVLQRSKRPLQLQGFKASYRTAEIERRFMPLDDCELSAEGCDESD